MNTHQDTRAQVAPIAALRANLAAVGKNAEFQARQMAGKARGAA